MKKTLIRGLAIVLIISFILPSFNLHVHAESKKTTIKKYIELLITKSKLKNPENIEELEIEKTPTKYILTARALGIIKEGEFKNYNKNITRANVAVLTNRVDELLNGENHDKHLYNRIVDWGRISDYKKISEVKKDAVVKMYLKGIMVGDSNGMYTHSRKFKPGTSITKKDADAIVTKLVNKKKRTVITPYGEVTRTTKLPKNYKQYDYILESFPNAYYEKKFLYKNITYYYEPKEIDDYAPPIKMKKHPLYLNRESEKEYYEIIYTWSRKLEINLETRLNIDYRTVDDTWINKLRGTYYTYIDYNTGKPSIEGNKPLLNEIKDYVKKVKNNKTIIKGIQISVDPSSLYYDGGYRLRAHIRFKIESANVIPTAESLKQEDVIFTFGKSIYFKGLKKNQWVDWNVDLAFNGRAINGKIIDYDIVYDGIGYE